MGDIVNERMNEIHINLFTLCNIPKTWMDGAFRVSIRSAGEVNRLH